tara:strand:+ start:738 stop:959 length:222 start_codon:yes stop_codon:yes gene_type:complete
MATIHIHPTATHRACIKALQARTGLVAVVTGKTAQLVSHSRFSNDHVRNAPRISRKAAPQNWATPDGDGPTAA